jgi:hypothetical protein
VQKYTVPGLDPVAAGRDLQVDSVLEGSIQTAGDRLRTTVRLLRVSDGSTLWAGTFDERLTDIFSVQDQVSQRVAGALALELTEAQRSLLTRRDTKRVGHAAMVAFLRLNGRRLEATVDEAEQAILQVASGVLARNGLQDWIQAHEVPA